MSAFVYFNIPNIYDTHIFLNRNTTILMANLFFPKVFGIQEKNIK